ncbi:MAG: TonB-linked SusC/RagA family outer membrane protein [Saprospiraceae bacterium]|jgi:TonB-linked SusC/RagA family outer membrane protein
MKKMFTNLGLSALLVILCQSFAFSQQTVAGVITDSAGDAVIGANVIVKGTTVGTITDIDGGFSLIAPAGATTLEVSYLGYLTQSILLSDNNFGSIVMSEDINQMDEIVITGLATSVKRKNLANSVAKIDAAELTGIAAPASVEAALYGKFKGAEIKAASGAPGGGLAFKLRGTTSISGSSQPLIILDGIYMDNSSIPSGLNIVSAASSGGSTSNQDNPSNRLSDLDPADIESIEILKGASAAAIYGSRAAGGVVIITTKKGKAGETVVRVSQSIGQASQLKKLGVREWTEERVLGSNFAGNIDDFRNNGVTNYEDLLYGNKATLYNTKVSVSGGSEKTQFYAGASYKNEDGIVSNTGYQKTSVRLNVDHKISKVFDVSMTTNYVNSSADRGFFNNDNSGTTMGVSFSSTPGFADLQADPVTGLFPANPYAPSNFLETAEQITNNESINRFIGGGSLTAKIFTKENQTLKAVFRGGADFYSLNTKAIFPNSLQFQRDGAGLNGVSVQGFAKNLNSNIAALLVHNYYGSNGISFTTSAGVTQEDFNRDIILGEASNLIGAQTNLDQAGNRNVTQARRIQQDKGFFVQEEFNFDDKFLATVGVRGDKSSNNSDVNKLYYYPKANLAVNLHNLIESVGPFTQVKVRAAYGESGNFAQFGAKSTILGSSIVDGLAGVAVPSLLGNSAVGPERQKELEFGADFEINNRYSMDVTYYIKSVTDLLLNANVPASSGFASQVTNAASLQNRGIELGLNLGLINTEDVTLGSRFSFWKNTAEVTKLDVPAFTLGGFADFLGNFMVKEGFSPTTIIGVGSDPTVTLNGDGAPTLQVFGNAEPDFQLSWMNNLRYKNFDLNFVWHWKKGGSNINLSTLLFDLNNTTHDFDDTGLDPSGELENGPYRLSQLGANTDPYVEDASYIRLREIGLYYTLPAGLVPGTRSLKVGFSGNNLINIFDYNSYDPEVSNFGGGGLSTGVEVLPFPSSKRFDFHVIAEF